MGSFRKTDFCPEYWRSDRARMNAAIRTFQRFAIDGENGGQCTIEDLKSIGCEDFQVLLDDITAADAEKKIFS